MSKTKINRRNFLKVLGLGGAGAALAGCDMPSTVTLEEGEEKIYSYLAPEEYVIPGVGVWYASTCLQCPAACGTHGRVREGRVLKLEGNPDSAVNAGKLCQMGQAALQAHFNPDRITAPLINGQPASWDDALALINEKASGGNVAWMTGTVSGHQRVLLDAHLAATGKGHHYAVETVNARAWTDAGKTVLGDAMPTLHLDKAKAVLSLGADLLGTWISPVTFMGQYGKFRAAPRGVLIMVEPAMSLTGANADQWVAAKPGTEAAVALGVGHLLMTKHGLSLNGMPNATSAFQSMTPAQVHEIAGVSEAALNKIADTLVSHSPSLVIANASHAAARIAMVLNIMLGNVGKTLTPGASIAADPLAPMMGSSKDLAEFAQNAAAGKIDAVFISGANPAFVAPQGLDMAAALKAVGFKVAIATCHDETTKACDVVLPLSSALEDWGTHVPAYGGKPGVVHLQQPLMEPLHADTRGLGDILLTLGKSAGVDGLDAFEDYYGYLRTAVSAMIGSELEGDWHRVLQAGQFETRAASRAFSAGHDVALGFSETAVSGLHLVTVARQGLYDGRHANSSWLQEAPDQISKAVWDSWAEIHPKTAASLNLKDGDYVRLTTASGAITTRVFIYKGVHPNAVCVPMGRGHTDYGRWANNGVNPLTIVDAHLGDWQSSEIIATASLVKIDAAGENRHLVRLMDTDQQYGRKLVATIPAQQFGRTQGGA
ncbi:MAG: molybdopterin-dependent oxidoreductase [Rhodospirillales bacterium]|nr:molybdopterin-dependent oxidoreductase [Rhodospirillales bacterium]